MMHRIPVNPCELTQTGCAKEGLDPGQNLLIVAVEVLQIQRNPNISMPQADPQTYNWNKTNIRKREVGIQNVEGGPGLCFAEEYSC